MKYEFIKMQASGNDYIYFDCFEKDVEDPVSLAKKMSPRHFSVGSDGIVLILPSDACDAKMRIFNADGSEAKSCGNALRCIGKFLSEKFPDRKEFTVETGGGVREISVSDGKIRVNMGKASVGAFSRKIIFEAKGYIFYSVKIGNLHNVLFSNDPEKTDIANIGRFVQESAPADSVPNVEFVGGIKNGRTFMRVWERGSGETMSCSSGAAAVAAAAEKTGRIKKGEILTVETPGGITETEVTDGGIMISGDAHTVFRGVFDDEDK